MSEKTQIIYRNQKSTNQFSRILNIRTNNEHIGAAVIYVMMRDQRAHDNHALLAAQAHALEKQIPLIVVFNLLPQTGVRSREHFEFMLQGLERTEKELNNFSIPLWLTYGDARNNVVNCAKSLNADSIFFDFNPLKNVRTLQKNIASDLKCSSYVVDTHNVIPVWVVSDKEEFAAHTMRNKVHKKLENWLQEPEKLQKHPYSTEYPIPETNWNEAQEFIKAQRSGIVTTFDSGEAAAHQVLQQLISSRLKGYAHDRNTPTIDGQSDLSPYLHFGQISSLRVALELCKQSKEQPLLLREARLAKSGDKPLVIDGINSLLEEMIVRKELADNYCFYNEDYDNLNGAKEWAQKTLNDHRNDPRDFLYSLEQFEQAQTHDEAWNAAQNQLRRSGKIHGYMRMYWAKKILEWSGSPEKALEIAIYLNDHYSIDGGDPNGYNGIMWSIAGVHDRPWTERSVFGKIRYMNYAGLKRKFDIEAYIQQHNSLDLFAN